MSAIAQPPKSKVTPKIPKMSDLTGAAPASAEPKTGDTTLSTSPITTPPPVEPKDDLPVIPTGIIGAERGAPGKTQQAIIEERRKAKAAKEAAGEATGEAEQFKIQLVEAQAARDKLQVERDKLEQDRKDFEGLAKKREEEINEVRQGYFQQHQPIVDPAQDETFMQAHATMVERLVANLPARIHTAAGDQRVFADRLLNDPAKLGGLHNILESYSKAVELGNEDAIDLSVNAAAQWMGADIDITSSDKNEWRTLDKNDQVFMKIEDALKAAAPQYRIKAERFGHIRQTAPQLAKQQFEKKIGGLRQTLKDQVFMSKDAAVNALGSDPNDSQALFSLIVQAAPELKDHVEATLGGYAETFATVSDQLRLPTLASNEPAAIQQHRSVLVQHQQRLARAMRNAVIGECIGPILASLIAERDAAEARAAGASEVTNPGSVGGQGGSRGGSEPKIPTSIIGAGMK